MDETMETMTQGASPDECDETPQHAAAILEDGECTYCGASLVQS